MVRLNKQNPQKQEDISGFSRYKYGDKYKYNENEYTVLLVGGSKCGKSTIIDVFANFFMDIGSPKNGVQVTGNYQADTGDSHVIRIDQDFLIYTFWHDYKVFNFIDSPRIDNEFGFEDIKRKFQDFITQTKQNNFRIHAVGLVIQNHIVRLTPDEEEMLKFVKDDLLGGNTENLIPFITFADVGTPPVLEALQTLGIDTTNHLVFNNVCLNSTTKEINETCEIYWDEGRENIQKGINTIMQLDPIDFPLKELTGLRHIRRCCNIL